MGDQQATDFEIGWLAGIIDGEGWLGMTLNGRAPRVVNSQERTMTVKLELKITNTDEAIVNKAAAIFARLGVNAYRRAHKGYISSHRIVHECATKNMTGVEKIIRPLLPHLTGVKHERALLMLRFIELRRANPGVVRPGFDERSGKRGPRHIRPYTAEEMAIVQTCRDLQSLGASETTRANRDRAVKALQREHALRLTEWSPLPDMI